MIVIIGDSGAGKSCLLKRFADPDFKVHDEHTATVGVDFVVRQLTVLNQQVKLQVWDTAGQERFRSVTAAYYRGSMGAIVCYDCLDDKSFDNAESWLSEFRTKSKEDSPIVLVATKKDKEVDSKVSPIKGENLASKFSARFIQNSKPKI